MQIDGPEAIERRACAGDDGFAEVLDGDFVGCEGSLAPVVAELADGDERTGSESGEDVGLAGGRRQGGMR